MTRWPDRPAVGVLGLAILVALTQWGGMAREVFDWDESTFILMAGRLLHGHLPYVDLFDNKPPMIFFELAAVMAVLGENLVSIRLFGDACLLVIVLLSVAIVGRFTPGRPALLSGVMLVAIMAIWPGQHTSTELPAMAMIMAALLLLLKYPDRLWSVACAGLLISLATLTRTNLAVVAIAGGAYLVIAGAFFPQTGFRRWSIVPYTLGGLAPVFMFLGIYWYADALDVLVLSTVTVPFNYSGTQVGILSALKQHLHGWEGIARRFPIWIGSFTLGVLAGCAVVLARLVGGKIALEPGKAGELILVLVFFLSVLLSVLMSGAVYAHYWLHVLPFVCMATAPLFDWLLAHPRRRWLAGALIAVTTLSALRHTTPDIARMVIKPDYIAQSWTIRRAADAIAEVSTPEDQVWALNHHLILWYLGKPPVTWVAAHPGNITREAILTPLIAAGYVPADVLQQTYDSLPAFIVNTDRGPPSYLTDKAYLETYLKTHYALFFEAPGIIVYRRLGHRGWSG